jgi:hypothetical protein
MSESGQPPSANRMPRLVKVFAVVGAIIAVGLVVMLLTGHDPGRHMRHSGAPPAVVRQ